MDAWREHLPEIQHMGVNTVRLAFRFQDSNSGPDGYVAADTLDFEKMDNVLEYLSRNDMKAVLDCHNMMDMNADFGSQKLIDDWVRLAEHYRGDARIVAYELFNEPYPDTWHASVKSKKDVAEAYQRLTKEIRGVDPLRIMIWQSQPYLPVLDTVSGFFEPNIVFAVHRWWHKEDYRFTVWNTSQLSYVNLGYMVEMRQKLDVPFWLGEFGSYYPFDGSNPEYLLVEQTLLRCEEQTVGWNLWMGRVTGEKPFDSYASLFPLEACAVNPDEHAGEASLVKLTGFIESQYGADKLEPYQVELDHNGDFLVLRPALTIIVISSRKVCNDTYQTVSIVTLDITANTVITNEEGTAERPGYWNTVILAIAGCQK